MIFYSKKLLNKGTILVATKIVSSFPQTNFQPPNTIPSPYIKNLR